MSNIMDYLNLRADISLKKDNINEIDKIILARFSYLPFKAIELKKKDTIENISKKMEKLDKNKFCWKDDKEFIIKLGQTNRYKNLIISDYKEIVDLNAEKQFAAITIKLPHRLKYISFRGTDMSLVGWKEDFNMSFMQDIPSQKEAVKYLNEVGKRHIGKLIIGGHSKGGNIGVYAAMYCDVKVKNKIIEIINADGPGFNENIIKSKEYFDILERINTYIPQSSIIGRLLEHEDDYEIIYSTQKGIMQHDLYSWQVDGVNLVRIQNLTDESKFVNKVVRNWLQNTTLNQRENFVNLIYDVLLTTEAKDITDFGVDTINKIKTVIKSYKNIEKEDKKEIEEMFKLLFESIINTIKETRKEEKV